MSSNSKYRSLLQGILEQNREEPWLHQCDTLEQAHAIRIGLKRAQKQLAQYVPGVANWKIGLKDRLILVDPMGRQFQTPANSLCDLLEEEKRETELRVVQAIKEDFENGEFNLSHAVALAEDAGVRDDIIKEVLGNATDAY